MRECKIVKYNPRQNDVVEYKSSDGLYHGLFGFPILERLVNQYLASGWQLSGFSTANDDVFKDIVTVIFTK